MMFLELQCKASAFVHGFVFDVFFVYWCFIFFGFFGFVGFLGGFLSVLSVQNDGKTINLSSTLRIEY